MSYRIAGVDVHKKMLAVVVSDVEVDGEHPFERRMFGSNPEQLRSLAAWLVEQEGARRRSGTLHLAQAQSNRGRRGRKRDFPDAEHRLCRDHNQSFFPGGPEAMGSNPRQFVDNIQPWPRTPTLQKSKLLPEGEVLQEKIPTVTKDANKCTEAEKRIDHGPELYQKHGGTPQ
jgi:hypothetical protein